MLRKLNLQHWTQEVVDAVIAFIKIGTTLPFYSTKRRKFEELAEHLSYAKMSLWYEDRQIVPQEKVQNVLKKLYQDPSTFSNSRDRFYGQVTQMYIGISRRVVQDFLNNQESYQMHKPVIKQKTVKPIITGHPNQRYQIDLVDMSAYAYWNGGYHFLLTIVDLFSKRAWVYALKNKTAAGVNTKIKHLLEHGNIPKVLQSDRGPEFLSLGPILAKYGTKHVMSQPYKPTSQGAVESFNKTLKRLLFGWMTQYKTKKWIDILYNILDNYNNSKHTTTKQIPYKIHYKTNTAPPANFREIEDSVASNIKKTAQKMINSKVYPGKLAKGVDVRISNWVNPNERKRKTFAKKYLPNWSREVYSIVSVSSGGFGREQYTLKDDDGNRLTNKFYRDEIQPLDAIHLVKNTDHRPNFGGPDREGHIKKLATLRKTGGFKKVTLPAKNLVEDRAKRTIKKNRLLGHLQDEFIF
jgi:hypothetical protein